MCDAHYETELKTVDERRTQIVQHYTTFVTFCIISIHITTEMARFLRPCQYEMVIGLYGYYCIANKICRSVHFYIYFTFA